MPATIQQARTEKKCQHCEGKILPGQMYYKRSESGRVHNRMEYYFIEWHSNKKDCQPHCHKDNCTKDCRNR